MKNALFSLMLVALAASPALATGFVQRQVVRQRIVVPRRQVQRVVVKQQVQPVVQRVVVQQHAQPVVVQQHAVQQLVVPNGVPQAIVLPQSLVVQPQAVVVPHAQPMAGAGCAAFFQGH